MYKSDADRLEKMIGIMERNPKSAFTEGYRRNCNVIDKYNFLYTSVSSGKDSLFMCQMSLIELMRRQEIIRKLALGEKRDERLDLIRKIGIATQNVDDIKLFERTVCGDKILAEKCKKRNTKFKNREMPEGISELDKEMGLEDPVEMKKRFLWRLEADEKLPEMSENRRIGILSMTYEMSFDETDEVFYRIAKEYCTDIRLIEPDGEIDLEKSVKKNGYNLSWVSENPKENPHCKTKEEIENMRPYELANIYGKAVGFLFYMCQSISWENSQGTDSSRYISFDPNCKNIWVKEPPKEHDPFNEWLITNENLYDSHCGLSPMIEVLPAMTDQKLRVEFSKFISRAIPEALDNNWPATHYNEQTGKYEY